MKKVKVFILSRDRAQMLKVTILSVLNQTRLDLMDVVVSDNSMGGDVESMMKRDFPNVKYVRRLPSLTAQDHFRQILCEVDSEFFMMFHDDDIMLPDMVGQLYNKITSVKGFVAVASNAYFLLGGKVSRYRARCMLRDKVIKSPRDLAALYLGLQGNAPFCGYMYRSKFFKYKALRWDVAGKYSDVIFLMDGLEVGSIMWVRDALMITRVHRGSDSAQFDSCSMGLLLGNFMHRFAWRSTDIRFVPMELIVFWHKMLGVNFFRFLLLSVMRFNWKLTYPILLICMREAFRIIDGIMFSRFVSPDIFSRSVDLSGPKLSGLVK